MRLLPKAQREAMYEVYAFCRAVDDIADDGGPRDMRLAQLRAWRADIDALYAGTRCRAPGPCARRSSRSGCEREDFQAVIDGMDMDVVADIRAPDWTSSISIAIGSRARSAGSRVRIFGMDEKRRRSRSPIISAARCS